MEFYKENPDPINQFNFKEDHGKYQIESKVSRKTTVLLRTLS